MELGSLGHRDRSLGKGYQTACKNKARNRTQQDYRELLPWEEALGDRQAGREKEEGKTGLGFGSRQCGQHGERKDLGKRADSDRHLRGRGVRPQEMEKGFMRLDVLHYHQGNGGWGVLEDNNGGAGSEDLRLIVYTRTFPIGRGECRKPNYTHGVRG